MSHMMNTLRATPTKVCDGEASGMKRLHRPVLPTPLMFAVQSFHPDIHACDWRRLLTSSVEAANLISAQRVRRHFEGHRRGLVKKQVI